LPKVVACWEREFEAADFRGEYLAVVDFTVDGDTGQIHDAELRQMLRANDPAEPLDGPIAERLGECLERALGGTNLADAGFTPGRDVRVRGYRIAFADATFEAREAASKRSPNVLLGPRADRCQGLYGYDPPRDAPALFAELASAKAAARRESSSDPDGHARALQRQYDLSLELHQRLVLDADRQDVPLPSRERLERALDEAAAMARTTGRRIGCPAPPLER